MASATTKMIAAIENLDAATEFLEIHANSFGLDGKRKFGLNVAFEEAFVNICNYAYPDSAGEIELTCSNEGEALIVEISDSGSPFDVLSLSDPDTTAGIQEREIGGLGVYFIRQFTDAVSYRRVNGRNVLRLILNRDAAGGE